MSEDTQVDDRNYGLAEIAERVGMSTRWVRDRIRLDGVEHQRMGNRIKMTAAQIDALRDLHTTRRSA